MQCRSLAALLLALSVSFALAQSVPAQTERHFTFHYAFTVKNVGQGERVRVWIPLAHHDALQDVKITAQSGDLALKQVPQSEYGNVVLYAEAAKADSDEYKFSVDYDVVRREHRVLTNGQPAPHDGPMHPVPKADLARYLQADRLVPITGVPADLAAAQTKGATTQLDKAKDIYEYVFRTMRYDKTGTGWGRGDVLYACDARKGNCTDFHSLFIAMARSQGIPARFEIGFPLPLDKHSSEIAGYHCWADFFEPQHGWIPVDISEAWKHQEKRDYFFGAHDANRVQFTMGRDLELNPKQEGKALNYFVYPYVELGGQEYSNVSTAFSFADVESGATANR